MTLPARISKYELLEFLGGGMSHVYRARDTVLGRTVAIKILTPAGIADAAAKARFLQEARTAGNISHDNILAVYDFGEEDGKPFMVMEFLRGRTLRSAIKEKCAGDLAQKLKTALEIARAIAHVHAHGIVHRDIKPENVHIDESGRAKLMDFGIAKAADLTLTQPGYVLGTPYYMAPEQVKGDPVTPLADVYSFGILLYELLTCQRPFEGPAIEQVFFKILNEPVNLDPVKATGAPNEVVSLVGACTQKDPARRPASFAPIIASLESALANQTAVYHTPEKRMPRLWLWMLLGALLIAAVAIPFLTHSPTPTKQEPKQEAKKQSSTPPARIDTPTGPMLLINAGTFLAGKDKHSVDLPAFYIDENDVSNAVYAQFCKETGHALPPGFPSGADDSPVVNVTVAGARAFASWANKRLPAAVEWEKAARGSDGRLYPWGDEPRAPQQPSPYGVRDLVHHVWQMVDGPITPSPEAISHFVSLLKPPPTASEPWINMRGGASDTPIEAAVAYEFASIPERYHAPNIGFRCAR